MANKRIKFIFFSEKIFLRNSDFSLTGLWDYLLSKRNSMEREIILDVKDKVPKNDPFSKFMLAIKNQLNHFLISTRIFKDKF